ncbi:MAG: DedA family protein [Rickettsiales bacterium]|jgi:membrane protein YqaA with SNARE-associated domain|nr:DedA family protein [Rickettsiales bacterium]
MLKLLRKLYEYVLRLSRTRYAAAALVFVAFFESTVFPLPTEVVMIPMILARPRRAFAISTVSLGVNVLGGLLGYYIGACLFDSVGIWILETMGYTATFERFAGLYREWGSVIVFAGGFTPLPYKVITIASGFVKMDLWMFIVASLVARALRYYLIAWLLHRYGERANAFIEKHLGKITAIVCVFIIAGFAAMKLV